MREYKCSDGRTYIVSDRHCLFCDHCTDIFWDYTHGIYLMLCNINKDTRIGEKGECDCFVEDEVTE